MGTKLKTDDGLSVDTLAVETFGNIMRALSLIDVLDNESLTWLREQLRFAKSRADSPAYAVVYDSLCKLCNDEVIDYQIVKGKP